MTITRKNRLDLRNTGFGNEKDFGLKELEYVPINSKKEKEKPLLCTLCHQK
jgi:hypothetical protein